MGGDDADVGGKVIAQLVDLVDGVKQLGSAAESVAATHRDADSIDNQNDEAAKQQLDVINSSLNRIGDVLTAGYKAMQKQKPVEEKALPAPKVEVINQPVQGLDKVLRVLANTMENSIFPLVRTMDKKIDIDLRTHDKMAEISAQLRELESELKGSTE